MTETVHSSHSYRHAFTSHFITLYIFVSVCLVPHSYLSNVFISYQVAV